VREIRTLRVMRRELETGARGHLRPTAPVPDPTNCADPHDLVAVGDSHPTCRSRLKIFGTTNHGSRPSKSYQCTGKRNATADKPNGNPLLHHGREVFSVPAS
jgi:hypothetical protein